MLQKINDFISIKMTNFIFDKMYQDPNTLWRNEMQEDEEEWWTELYGQVYNSNPLEKIIMIKHIL